MKRILIAVAVLGAGTLLVVLSVETPDPSTPVEVTTVEIRDFVATVQASGVVRPEESVDLSAEVVGRLLEVRVVPGDPVERGRIVALIDDATQRPIVEEQRAMLRAAETDLADAGVAAEDARRELARARELHEEGVVSARRVEETEVGAERATHAVARAEQSVERTRSALRRAEEDLEKTIVRSPITGVVLSVDMEAGELVVASSRNLPGSTIMTLGTAGSLIVEADIPEVDVVAVQLGQPVRVHLAALPDAELDGEVIEIQRVGQREETRSFGAPTGGAEFFARVRLDDPPATVRPSMSAEVHIQTDRRADALALPIGSLIRRYPEGVERQRMFSVSMGSGGSRSSVSERRGDAAEAGEDQAGWDVVFVIEEDPRDADGSRAVERRIETGLTDLLEIEARSGLEPGDRVVVGPPGVLRGLSDGDPVRVADAAPPG